MRTTLLQERQKLANLEIQNFDIQSKLEHLEEKSGSGSSSEVQRVMADAVKTEATRAAGLEEQLVEAKQQLCEMTSERDDFQRRFTDAQQQVIMQLQEQHHHHHAAAFCDMDNSNSFFERPSHQIQLYDSG